MWTHIIMCQPELAMACDYLSSQFSIKLSLGSFTVQFLDGPQGDFVPDDFIEGSLTRLMLDELKETLDYTPELLNGQL